MNKIKIENNDMTLTVRMPDEEAEVWFGTLSRALLGDYPDIAEVIAPDASPAVEENAHTRVDEPPNSVEQPQPPFHNRGGGKNWKQ